MANNKDKKKTNAFWYYLDGFFDLFVVVFAYGFRIIKSIVGMFLRN